MKTNPQSSELLERARSRLAAQHKRTDHLDQLASMFDRVSSPQRHELICQFHDWAGRIPYTDDSDYGALLLESVADSVTDRALAHELYQHALFRARWCVQSATSGGEGCARNIDQERIASKFTDAN